MLQNTLPIRLLTMTRVTLVSSNEVRWQRSRRRSLTAQAEVDSARSREGLRCFAHSHIRGQG